MIERIRQAREAYRTYSVNWGRMPWRVRGMVGLVGALSGWVSFAVMAAAKPITSSSGHLDVGPPVISVTVVLVVNLVGQHVGYWWWRRQGHSR